MRSSIDSINKIQLLKLSLLTIFSLLFSIPYIYAQNPTRPNIIFILTDDQRWDALGYVGNDIILTPNLDQLAADGIYFENAFVTTPICAASRASIMTGLYERTHQFTFQTPPLRRIYVEQSYPALLKKAGYQLGFFGKFGMSWEAKLDTTIFDSIKTNGTNGYFRLRGEGWRDHVHLTDLTTDEAIDFMNQQTNDRPFCVSISYNAPHADDQHPQQYFWAKRNDSLYKNVQIPFSSLHEDIHFDELPDFLKADSTIGRIRWKWRFDTREKYQRMVKGYYRMISTIDDNIGRLREQLATLGIADNTILIFTSDNGYFLGERALAGKWLMYENSLRVPLILYDPKGQTKQNISQMALNIDIAPTILDYAGVPIPKTMQGESLRPFVNGAIDDWRTHFLCEHLYDIPYIPKSEGVRTENWKYFRYLDHPETEALYHLKNDPLEQENLAEKTAYQTQLQKHRTLLKEYRTRLEAARLK